MPLSDAARKARQDPQSNVMEWAPAQRSLDTTSLPFRLLLAVSHFLIRSRHGCSPLTPFRGLSTAIAPPSLPPSPYIKAVTHWQPDITKVHEEMYNRPDSSEIPNIASDDQRYRKDMMREHLPVVMPPLFGVDDV